MEGVLSIPFAVLLELNAFRIILLILFSCIVAALTFCARKGNQRSHIADPFSYCPNFGRHCTCGVMQRFLVVLKVETVPVPRKTEVF